jgi:hypothetical protein
MVRRGPHKPETIARMRAAACKHWSDPDTRTRHGALTKRRMALPGVSERIAMRTKAAMADPDTRARHRAAVVTAMASPVVRQRISDRTREAMADPAVRQRIRDGMVRARHLTAELQPVRALWATLSNEARDAFCRELSEQERS